MFGYCLMWFSWIPNEDDNVTGLVGFRSCMICHEFDCHRAARARREKRKEGVKKFCSVAFCRMCAARVEF